MKNKEVTFKSYKHLETYLKNRTSKEFFITCTKSNKLTVVKARNNKLITYTMDFVYWSWFTEAEARLLSIFINQE